MVNFPLKILQEIFRNPKSKGGMLRRGGWLALIPLITFFLVNVTGEVLRFENYMSFYYGDFDTFCVRDLQI